MAIERIVENARAAQLGFVLKAYRRSFQDENGRTGISQEELLRRMGAVDDAYDERFSHATVSRWEGGATRPSVDRLRTIGKALNLSQAEIAGLILLAGLASDFEAAGAVAGLSFVGVSSAQGKAPDAWSVASTAKQSSLHNSEPRPSLLRAFGGFTLRFLLVAAFITGVGYTLSALGWDGYWMPVAYICLTTTLVMVQGLVFPDREAGLRDFFWISLFFILAVPSLQFAPLQMDHYGFYASGVSSESHVPFMLSLLVNLTVATLCSMMFQLLRQRQVSQQGSSETTLVRAALVVLPPIGVAYAVVLVFSNASVWIQSAVVMWVLASVFIGLLVMRHPTVNPTQEQRRFLLSAAFTVAIVASTLGIVVVMAIYISPDLPGVLPDHNLLSSWEINFAELGYTRAEALERLNVGYMLHSTYLFVYMVFIVGGSFLKAVYRLAGGDAAGPGAAYADTLAPAPTRRGRHRDNVRRLLWSPPLPAVVRGRLLEFGRH